MLDKNRPLPLCPFSGKGEEVPHNLGNPFPFVDDPSRYFRLLSLFFMLVDEHLGIVDDPVDIAGAAFTIQYDGASLTLSAVESDFFDTFANQWTALSPNPSPQMPPRPKARNDWTA